MKAITTSMGTLNGDTTGSNISLEMTTQTFYQITSNNATDSVRKIKKSIERKSPTDL
jgi:hypothetical protein